MMEGFKMTNNQEIKQERQRDIRMLKQINRELKILDHNLKTIKKMKG